MIDLGWLKDQLETNPGEGVNQYLNQEEMETYQGFNNPGRAIEWLGGRVVAKKAVSLYMKNLSGHRLRLTDIAIKNHESGQPYCSVGGVLISISHKDHIAFAAAEFGTALEVLNLYLAIQSAWPIALGIVLIGLVNFLVSFGLSLATALESRNITWRELRSLVAHLTGSFIRRPLDWFFPPKDAALQ